jgi:hypothetical protein
LFTKAKAAAAAAAAAMELRLAPAPLVAPHRLRFPLHLAPGPSFVAVVASLHIYIHYACRYLSTFITHIDTNRRSFTYQ